MKTIPMEDSARPSVGDPCRDLRASTRGSIPCSAMPCQGTPPHIPFASHVSGEATTQRSGGEREEGPPQ
eukprot:1791279-Pyramimonas_sp.AAC.1